MAKKNMTLEEKLEEAIVKDGPYEVPGNWVLIKLSELVNFERGITFPASAKKNEKSVEDIACLRTANIQQVLEIDDLIYVDKKHMKSNKNKIVQSGDILMSTANSLELVGKSVLVPNLDEEMTFGGFVLNIRNKGFMNNKFIYYYLRAQFLLGNLQNIASQTTNIANINAKNLGEYVVTIPPLKEQQRIVDRIESLFEKLDKAKELIEEAREGFEKRKSAVLEKAFSGELTEKWRKNNLRDNSDMLRSIKQQRLEMCKGKSDLNLIQKEFNDSNFCGKIKGWINIKAQLICDFITKGETPSKFVTKNGDIPFLKVYNIRENRIDFEYDKSFIPVEIHKNKMKRSKVFPGDVVMNIVGPPLQKVAVVTDEYSEWNINQAIAIFRPINFVLSKYMYYCLLCKETLKDILIEVRGVVGQSNISLEQCRNIIIPLPCKEEQKEIVKILDKLLEEESKIEELTQLEDQIELIKKSILAKAFRGELGTNSEKDESALELLKKILSKDI